MLIVFGVFLYLVIAKGYSSQITLALFFFFVGVITIAAAAYSAILARRRHPRP